MNDNFDIKYPQHHPLIHPHPAAVIQILFGMTIQKLASNFEKKELLDFSSLGMCIGLKKNICLLMYIDIS